jgi:hypothetical protein
LVDVSQAFGQRAGVQIGKATPQIRIGVLRIPLAPLAEIRDGGSKIVQDERFAEQFVGAAGVDIGVELDGFGVVGDSLLKVLRLAAVIVGRAFLGSSRIASRQSAIARSQSALLPLRLRYSKRKPMCGLTYFELSRIASV